MVRPVWQRPREESPRSYDRKMFPIYKVPIDILASFSLFECTCQEMNVPQWFYMTILHSLVSGALLELMGQLLVHLSYYKFKA